MLDVQEREGRAEFRLAGRVIATGHRAGEPFAAQFRKTVERMMKEAARVHAARVAVDADPSLGGLLTAWTLNLTPAQLRRLRARVQAFRDDLHALQREPLVADGARSPVHVLLGFAPLGRGVPSEDD